MHVGKEEVVVVAAVVGLLVRVAATVDVAGQDSCDTAKPATARMAMRDNIRKAVMGVRSLGTGGVEK